MNGFSNKPAAVTILACDTTQHACSACVYLPCGACFELYKEIGRGHAECLPPMLGDVMAEAAIDFTGLDRLAVTIGPGTFAGVRVGLAAVRALSLICAVPVQTVSTLKALAANIVLRADFDAVAQPPFIIGVAIDARRAQFYTQIFAADLTPLTEPQIQTAEHFIDACTQHTRAMHAPRQVKLIGSAAPLFARHLPKAEIIDESAPRAKIIAQLAACEPPPQDTRPPTPLYLRPPDARPNSQAALRMA